MKPGVVFFNFPISIDRSTYDEAIARYVGAVEDRAVAIYQVGNISHPGLSDIDLVDVFAKPAWVNNQFFSPSFRLTRTFRPLFHHGPRFIPMACMDALEYSSCAHAAAPYRRGNADPYGSNRTLVSGIDVLGHR